MRDLSWYSSVWVSLASGSREKDGNSVPTDCPAPQGSLPRVSSHMPSELLLHFFFLVFFKAAVVGLSAGCPWIVAFSVLWMMNSKHCLAADAIFTGAGLPPQSRPGMFSDTTLPGRTYRGGGIGLVLVLISELAPWVRPWAQGSLYSQLAPGCSQPRVCVGMVDVTGSCPHAFSGGGKSSSSGTSSWNNPHTEPF